VSYDQLLKGRLSLAGNFYCITTVTSCRHQIFNDFNNARILAGELRKLHETGTVFSYAWVVMPDHLHWIFQLEESGKLSEVVRLLKGRSARKLNHLHREKGTVWQAGFYEHVVRQSEDLRQMANYVLHNPIRAGLVEDLGKYPSWDASWLWET
jgi:putative transposase